MPSVGRAILKKISGAGQNNRPMTRKNNSRNGSQHSGEFSPADLDRRKIRAATVMERSRLLAADLDRRFCVPLAALPCDAIDLWYPGQKHLLHEKSHKLNWSYKSRLLCWQ